MSDSQCSKCGSHKYRIISGPSSPAQAKQYRGIVLTRVRCIDCGTVRSLDLSPSIETEYSDFMFKSSCGLIVALIVFLITLFFDSTFFIVIKYLAGAYLIFGIFDILRAYFAMQDRKHKKGL